MNGTRTRRGSRRDGEVMSVRAWAGTRVRLKGEASAEEGTQASD
ncbi:hypothetical protein [Nonomuraea maheshkhaliensis]